MRIALILGGAASVHSDVEEALDLGEFQGMVGCNLIGIEWSGSFDAWVSVHENKLKKPWRAARDRLGWPSHQRIWGPSDTEHKFPGCLKTGTSGAFALKVALSDLGFDKAVLAGIPMDASPHFDDEAAWKFFGEYRSTWEQIKGQVGDKVRSMSGWTAELFGRPTSEWVRT